MWRTNYRANQLCAWAGPGFAVLFGVGLALLAGFIPPTHPGASATSIVHTYRTDVTAFRFGLILMATGAGLILPWAMAIVAQTRRTELGAPVLSYSAMGSAIFIAVDASIICTIWAVASFRAGHIAPDVTLTLNDIGWFLFMFPWQAGIVLFLAVGLAIIWDTSDQPVYPRWLAWLSFWFTFMTFPDSLIVFFKHGPFSYHGLFAFYIPFGVLFVWMILMTYYTLQAIKRQAAAADRDERTAPAMVH
jgi:hypothetical protein